MNPEGILHVVLLEHAVRHHGLGAREPGLLGREGILDRVAFFCGLEGEDHAAGHVRLVLGENLRGGEKHRHVGVMSAHVGDVHAFAAPVGSLHLTRIREPRAFLDRKGVDVGAKKDRVLLLGIQNAEYGRRGVLRADDGLDAGFLQYPNDFGLRLHFLIAEFGHGVKLVAKRREVGLRGLHFALHPGGRLRGERRHGCEKKSEVCSLFNAGMRHLSFLLFFKTIPQYRTIFSVRQFASVRTKNFAFRNET